MPVRTARVAIEITIVLTAGLFCYLVACRGIFPLDQSIIFDGAYRIAAGQLPYRDFVFPHGLVVLLYQALIFALFGVTYSAYALGGGLLSALSALVSIRLVRALTNDSFWPPIVAGLIAAVWFISPFGTPYPEQTAFLLLLFGASQLLLLLQLKASVKRRNCGIVLAGVTVTLAFLSKQNIALLTAPLLIIVLIAIKRWQRESAPAGILFFICGALSSSAAVLAVVRVFGGAAALHNFWAYTIEIPSALGRVRMDRQFTKFLHDLGSPLVAVLLGFLFVAALVIAAWRACSALRKADVGSNQLILERILAGMVTIYLIALSYVAKATVFNSPGLAYVYIGVVIALTLWLYGQFSPWTIVARGTAIFVVALVMCAGLFFSIQRTEQDSVKDSQFNAVLTIPALAALRWGEPTIVGPPPTDDTMNVPAKDLEDLARYIGSKSFFIFPDFTFLYGALGQPSPQPLLWFHPGLTYEQGSNAELDAWIVTSLKQHAVAAVVIEERSFFGTSERLADFPQLREYIYATFEPTKNFGMFQVRERFSQN